VTVDVGRVLGSAAALVGFTAGTGQRTANQDVLAWRLSQ
jgi:hypothetical protein